MVLRRTVASGLKLRCRKVGEASDTKSLHRALLHVPTVSVGTGLSEIEFSGRISQSRIISVCETIRGSTVNSAHHRLCVLPNGRSSIRPYRRCRISAHVSYCFPDYRRAWHCQNTISCTSLVTNGIMFPAPFRGNCGEPNFSDGLGVNVGNSL